MTTYIIDLYDRGNEWIRSIINVKEEGLEAYIRQLKKIPLVWKIELTTINEKFEKIKIRTYRAKKAKRWEITPDHPESH